MLPFLILISFDNSYIDKIYREHNLRLIAKLIIDHKISGVENNSLIELFDGNWLDPVTKILEERIEEDNN